MCGVLQHSCRSGPIIHNPMNDVVIDRGPPASSLSFLVHKVLSSETSLVSMKLVKIDGLRKVYRVWYLDP